MMRRDDYHTIVQQEMDNNYNPGRDWDGDINSLGNLAARST